MVHGVLPFDWGKWIDKIITDFSDHGNIVQDSSGKIKASVDLAAFFDEIAHDLSRMRSL